MEDFNRFGLNKRELKKLLALENEMNLVDNEQKWVLYKLFYADKCRQLLVWNYGKLESYPTTDCKWVKVDCRTNNASYLFSESYEMINKNFTEGTYPYFMSKIR